MDGVFIINKPAGITSHDVVARVRRILNEKRVGHTGTLDPFATGVLVVLVGRATRLAQFLSGADKEYEAVIRLGMATDTGDVTGQLLKPGTDELPSFTRTEIEAALAALRGMINQVPPMHSAKKQQGKKLYELARRGEIVERQSVPVMIHSFELIGNVGNAVAQNEDGTTDVRVRILCSAGTYVRTLAEDLGKRLGVGAHVLRLQRTQAGDFSLERSITLEHLAERSQQGSVNKVMITPSDALQSLPFVSLNADEVRETQQGKPLELTTEAKNFLESGWVRMCDAADTLIAVGQFDREAKLLRPRVVLALEQ
jgi:tRNA pseudouridine55 synthase